VIHQSVFISHASEDRDVAESARAALEKQGIGCWVSYRDIEPGENYPQAIVRAINDASVLVLILSRNALASHHIRSEVHAAFDRQLPIVAFRIEDISLTEDMEYYVGSRNWIDAFDDPQQGIERFVAGIKESLTGIKHGKSAPARRAARPIQNRRRWVVYGLAALLCSLTFALLMSYLNTLSGGRVWLSILVGAVPAILVLPEVISQGREFRRRRLIEGVGETGVPRESEYFRTYPYDTVPDYMKEFRADKAHEKALAWINRSDEPLLFLTGRSGTGKTSILAAYVSPQLELQDPPTKTVMIRSFGDPIRDLREKLTRLSAKSADSDEDVRRLLERAAKNNAPSRLLVVLDQFEELLIINEREPERLRRVKDLLHSLVDNPIPGVTILLSLRTDYLPMLEDLQLPPLRDRENWFEVGSFTENHARAFLKGSSVPFSDATLEALFDQIAAFEGGTGLVRPIILNMVGLIASRLSEGEQAVGAKQTQNLNGRISETSHLPSRHERLRACSP